MAENKLGALFKKGEESLAEAAKKITVTASEMAAKTKDSIHAVDASQVISAGKESATAVGEKLTGAGTATARFISNGIGTIGSKISFSLASLKQMKAENKALREELKKTTITESVKQKVLLQLQQRITTLADQLKVEKQRNEQNEEMIAALQAQLEDLMETIKVAEVAKTA